MRLATQPALHLGSSVYVLLEPHGARVLTRDEALYGDDTLYVPARMLDEPELERALTAWQRNELGSWGSGARPRRNRCV